MNKFSFFPDKRNTIDDNSLPENIVRIRIGTKDNKKLSCLYLNLNRSKRILIYFHGNAGNGDQRLPELIKFSQMGINVLGAEYRGYGLSTGRPSEKGIFSDGNTILRYVIDSLKYDLDSIFICGRSIGTTVAIEVSRNLNLAGVILISPLTSGIELGKRSGLGFLIPFIGDPFNNLLKCDKLIAPVLVLHGNSDEVIPFDMGLAIFHKIQSQKTFIEIKKGHHNDMEIVEPSKYWKSIKSFLENNS